MAAGKDKSLPAPIDRPLSRAYLREFSGWSNEFPPNVSDPTTMRVMENVLVNREGSIRVRPGLRHITRGGGGVLPASVSLKSSHEVFYLADGSRAYLFATAEGGVVTFKALTQLDNDPPVVKDLTSLTGWTGVVPSFTIGTSYVRFLQIDNKIVALSNNGENPVVFYMGLAKKAEQPQKIIEPSITRYEPTVLIPLAGVVEYAKLKKRKNYSPNPKFKSNVVFGINNNANDVNLTNGTLGQKNFSQYSSGDCSIQLIETTGGNISAAVKVIPAWAVEDLVVTVRVKVSHSMHVTTSVQWLRSTLSALSSGTPETTYVAAGGWVDITVFANTSTVFEADDPSAWVNVHTTDASPGASIYIDSVLATENVGISPPPSYAPFDGDTPATTHVSYRWNGSADASSSEAVMNVDPRQLFSFPMPLDKAGSRRGYNADCLINKVDETKNVYNVGVFFTLANSFGESEPSKTTYVKLQRPFSQWKFETNVGEKPSGKPTSNAELMADQLLVVMPKDLLFGYITHKFDMCNVYMYEWGPQDAMPIEAKRVAQFKVPPPPNPFTVSYKYWSLVNATDVINADKQIPIPTELNKENYSTPFTAAQGLVAGDRMILVNNPAQAARIAWTSNHTGEYLNFTASEGGGYKTLSSGNLNVPACVKLWQNPESKDTLIVLCQGEGGNSNSYYMAPAEVGQQSDSTSVMGFEETTATEGTTSPYGCDVLNNALYHPVESELTKSTASNYNINHKGMTENISRSWKRLINKHRIVSAVLDNRIYYLVHNPDGAALEAGCMGNEIWVLDMGIENGAWSRWLVQGVSLRKIQVNGQLYMSLSRPDGLYYFDPEKHLDDYLTPFGAGYLVATRAIPWKLEMNTQGANRAHDAWAHLRQVTTSFGNFKGEAEWGVKGLDQYGKEIIATKRTTRYDLANPPVLTVSDFEDHLQVRRDMKEWVFFANSIVDANNEAVPSYGQISAVQYRYTPVSVNVGYEYGSIETFEYTRNMNSHGTYLETLFRDGVPANMVDRRLP